MSNLFGTGINQVPTNGMLGNLAFQDKAFVSVDKIGIGTTATDTGTANQTLQNYGGAYVSGNLGIGTTNPTSKLQVVGDTLVSGSTTITNNLVVNGSTLYVDGTNNRVGIGTNSPVNLFQVTGSNNSVGMTSDGRFLVGTSTSRVVGPNSRIFQLESVGIGATYLAGMSLTRNNTNGANFPVVAFLKTRGSSFGAIDAVTDGDGLGSILYYGADGISTTQSTSISIQGNVDGVVSAGTVPARLDISTRDASGTLDTRLSIGYSGNVGVGTIRPQTKLQVGGIIGFNDTNVRIGDSTTGSAIGIGTGTYNNFIGVGAGQSTTIGFNNNFFGYQAGIANTSGDNNSFFGYQSGFSNTSGSCNIFFGFQSGFCNIAASQNQFFGFQAGYYNTTGGGNLFIGRRAGYRNTSATFNNFIGRYAGCSNTIGTNNNFMGQSAGLLNTTGNRNNFFGTFAGCGNTSGSYNNFFGCGSGTLNTSGNENIFLGRFSGCTNATGSCNIVIGSGRTSTPVLNGDNQLVIGVGSTDWIIGNSSFNVGIGTTNPTSKLQVQGDALVSGIVTASQMDLTANASVNDSVLYLSGSPSGTASQSGLLGIGTLSFTDTNIIANFSHNVNSYAQLVVQNRNSGSTASADIIVNNDRTAGTTYYGDFGINATTYTGTSPFNDPDGTYLYAAGGTLAIGTNDAQDFRIATGSAVATPVTRMTITGVGGSVGIGTTTPTQPLDVNGKIRLRSGLYDINNNVGTASSILYSTGAGISWTSPSFFGASNLVVYTTGSAATYTAPSGLKYALVIATGGGGGGGGSDTDGSAGAGGGGGGSGGTAIRLYTSAQMGATATYTVGASGGGGSNTGGNGSNGGTTTFVPVGAGTSLTAGGGLLGTGTGTVATNGSAAGGSGVTPTGGQINIPGGDGGSGYGLDTGNLAITGYGGDSYWGGGGGSQTTTVTVTNAGLAGEAYGSGGGGAITVDNATGAIGGSGATGVIFILEFT